MKHWVFWGGHSVMGSKHDHNQDAWVCVGNNLIEGTLIVVADGVSSVKYGALTKPKTCAFFRRKHLKNHILLWMTSVQISLQLVRRLQKNRTGKGRLYTFYFVVVST